MPSIMPRHKWAGIVPPSAEYVFSLTLSLPFLIRTAGLTILHNSGSRIPVCEQVTSKLIRASSHDQAIIQSSCVRKQKRILIRSTEHSTDLPLGTHLDECRRLLSSLCCFRTWALPSEFMCSGVISCAGPPGRLYLHHDDVVSHDCQMDGASGDT